MNPRFPNQFYNLKHVQTRTRYILQFLFFKGNIIIYHLWLFLATYMSYKHNQ